MNYYTIDSEYHFVQRDEVTEYAARMKSTLVLIGIVSITNLVFMLAAIIVFGNVFNVSNIIILCATCQLCINCYQESKSERIYHVSHSLIIVPLTTFNMHSTGLKGFLVVDVSPTLNHSKTNVSRCVSPRQYLTLFYFMGSTRGSIISCFILLQNNLGEQPFDCFNPTIARSTLPSSTLLKLSVSPTFMF